MVLESSQAKEGEEMASAVGIASERQGGLSLDCTTEHSGGETPSARRMERLTGHSFVEDFRLLSRRRARDRSADNLNGKGGNGYERNRRYAKTLSRF